MSLLATATLLELPGPFLGITLVSTLSSVFLTAWLVIPGGFREARPGLDRKLRLLTVTYATVQAGSYLTVVPTELYTNATAQWLMVGALFGPVLVVSAFLTEAVWLLWHRRSIDTSVEITTDGTPWSEWRRSRLIHSTRSFQSKQLELETNPLDPRLRRELTLLHLGRGEPRSAIYHSYVLVELLPHGPSQALALYRLCQLLVGPSAEKNPRNLHAAQPYLRRLIRLYPRSYFASYARRLVNQYEAHAD